MAMLNSTTIANQSNAMQGQVDLRSLNLVNRANLINNSDLIMMPIVESFPMTPGKRERFLVSNVGFVTDHYIRATVQVEVAADAAAPATPSALAPFSIFSHIGLVDYSQRYRTNCTGWELFVANTLNWRRPHGRNNESQGTNNYPNLNIVAPVTAGNVGVFYIDLDANWALNYLSDLRGILPANNGGGNAYVELQLPVSLISAERDDTIPFYGDTAKTTITVTIDVVQQHYNVPAFDPANLWGSLPMIDILQAYEVLGHSVVSDNISAGKKKAIDYPVDREIAFLSHFYFVDGLVSNDNYSYVQLVRGSNYDLIERMKMQWHSALQRRLYGNDILPGLVVWDHSRKNILANKVGLFQSEIYPSTIGDTRELHTLYISFFALQAPISGISQ